MAEKRKDRRALKRSEHIKRLRLYLQGLNDTDIARQTGLSTPGVRSWRQRNKLRINRVKYCATCGQPMQGVWLKDGDPSDMYRFWRCPACGGEFWPAEEAEKEAG